MFSRLSVFYFAFLFYTSVVQTNLYAEAVFLPCFSSDCIIAEPKIDPLPLLTLEYETSYMEIQNPFRGPKVIEKSLDEDLLIIYQYLKAGMIEYEADKLGQALNEWKYEFNHHWGQQVMGALRALHTLRRSALFNNMHSYRKRGEPQKNDHSASNNR